MGEPEFDKIDLIECLRAAQSVPAKTDNLLWESAVNDPPEEFGVKFNRAVRGLRGFGPSLRDWLLLFRPGQ
jgi:hypothetical protein